MRINRLFSTSQNSETRDKFNNVACPAMFSLTFSSKGEGPSWPVRQKICTSSTVCWGGGGGSSRVMDMALPSLGNLGAKFSEMSFPQFKTYFTQIDHYYP